jgi:excisionase family DNA binding protein
MDKDFYTIQEFADKLGFCYRTIWRAIKNGRILAFRPGSSPQSPYRIAHSEFYRMSEIDLEKLIQKEVDKRLKE